MEPLTVDIYTNRLCMMWHIAIII